MESASLRFTRTIATLPIVAAALALIGWHFRLPVLKADMFGTFIAPNAALCFMLCGASIHFQSSESRWLQRLGIVIAACVTAFAFATMLEYVFNADFGIDRLFFAHRLSDWKLPLPGRFAFNTAVAFTFAGLSLVFLRRSAGRAISDFFAGLVLLIFYLSVVGYLYSASLLYSRVMSPHTALLFGLLGVALLCGSKRQVFITTFLSRQAGGIVFRRMLVAIVVLLPILGFVRLKLERRGFVTPDFGTAMFVILAVSMFTVLTLHTATVLNELDRRRQFTEAALIRSEKLAAAGRMAATVAHEINNPLEAVTNLLYLLRSNNCSSELRQEYLKTAEQELARVAEITRRTLGFYKEESRATNVDLRKLIDDVLELYARKLDTAGVTVQRTYGDGAQVHAPTGEIRQIITNLLTNAIDAVPARGGRISFVAEREGDLVRITISDNGHGIKSDDLARIFEPFFTTKRDVGNGLGLWVIRTLAEKNMGSIDVKTSTDPQNHGTAFTLTLPVARARLVPVSANEAASA